MITLALGIVIGMCAASFIWSFWSVPKNRKPGESIPGPLRRKTAPVKPTLITDVTSPVVAAGDFLVFPLEQRKKIFRVGTREGDDSTAYAWVERDADSCTAFPLVLVENQVRIGEWKVERKTN